MNTAKQLTEHTLELFLLPDRIKILQGLLENERIGRQELKEYSDVEGAPFQATMVKLIEEGMVDVAGKQDDGRVVYQITGMGKRRGRIVLGIAYLLQQSGNLPDIFPEIKCSYK